MGAKTFFFLWFFLAGAASYASEEPFGFQDLKLGSYISERTNDLRFACDTPTASDLFESCRAIREYLEEITVFNAPLQKLTLYYVADQLKTIVAIFDRKRYKDMIANLHVTYGAPHKLVVESYVSKYYEIHPGRIYMWRNGVSMLKAIQYFTSTGRSALMYTHSALHGGNRR